MLQKGQTMFKLTKNDVVIREFADYWAAINALQGCHTPNPLGDEYAVFEGRRFIAMKNGSEGFTYQNKMDHHRARQNDTYEDHTEGENESVINS